MLVNEIRIKTYKGNAKSEKCDDPEVAFRFFKNEIEKQDWFDCEKECVIVLILDRQNNLKAWNLVSLGTANSSLVHPREVLRPVIQYAGSAFILMHNHPSGNSDPSEADRVVTRQIREASKIMGIEFLDHVIAGDTYYSFVSNGFL